MNDTRTETDLERRVREWHESDSTLELHEWLGMTRDEYGRLLIGTSHVGHGSSLAQAEVAEEVRRSIR